MGLLRYVKGGIKLLVNQDYRIKFMRTYYGWYLDIPDEVYIKKLYKYETGKELNLDQPRTLCEKLQWLKIHDRRPEYTRMVDKFDVKQLVKEKCGEGYVIPAYGAWEKFEDISFDELPDKFVLKCTHDSGSNVVCENKQVFDICDAGKRLKKRLRRNYYWASAEWPYKNVKPRIMAEEYVPGLGKSGSIEYKLTCTNGKVRMITVCKGIPHSSFDVRTNDHYDRNYQILPFYVNYKNANPPVPLPEQTEELIELAEKLAEGIPYVRVDFYIIDGAIKFGEMTFFTWGGFMSFVPSEYDGILGDWVALPAE